ncbi:Rv2175c family DNA-binding protein [Corynebacterium crudilactis]|uniref:Transcriptional regulator n=1 Tax=Corynebacterium crudilactis TaxID=1652495 RepID=A0A172QUS0_9CORY|nr:Rv2175c family DNA-binding protein [Corynebacterium crudilactis]ANE04416.1 transcriptional regulator [Corynebacterium crudilactis]
MSSNNASSNVLPDNEPLLTLPEVAERLGVVVTKVMDLVNEHKLIIVRRDGIRHIPEAFLSKKKENTNRFIPGVIALLADGGFSDEEILAFLFTEDETLPGRPIDALHGQLAREVMRRAQAMAF